MVLLLPLLPRETVYVCICGHVGLRSPVRERSSFYPRDREAKRFESRCKACARRANLAYQKEQRENPATREEFLRRTRDTRTRYRERHRERVRDQSRRYRRRHGPELRERERIQRAIQRGDQVAVLTQGAAGVDLPIEPFRTQINCWIEQGAVEISLTGLARKVAVEQSKSRLCEQLGISARTLYRWRKEIDVVAEAIVDRALSRDGRLHIYDLYPQLREVDV